MIQYVLLAMQAAGMIVDWAGTKQQIDMGRMGAKIEQAGINANIQMTRLQTEDATLQAMKNLRQNLGSQIAMQAARGNATGAGSALSLFTESISNFKSDERTRRINLLARETELKAQGFLSRLHQETSEMTQWGAFRNRVLDKLPMSSAFGTQGGSGAGAKGVAPAGANGGSYGMTPV